MADNGNPHPADKTDKNAARSGLSPLSFLVFSVDAVIEKVADGKA